MRREKRGRKFCFLRIAELRKLICCIVIRRSRSVQPVPGSQIVEKMRKSGEDVKEECTKKDGGTGKRKKSPFLPFFFLFSCSRFFSSADPTISELGQAVRPLALYSQTVTRKPLDQLQRHFRQNPHGRVGYVSFIKDLHVLTQFYLSFIRQPNDWNFVKFALN